MFKAIKTFMCKLVAPVVTVFNAVANYVTGLFTSEKGSDEEPDPKPVQVVTQAPAKAPAQVVTVKQPVQVVTQAPVQAEVTQPVQALVQAPKQVVNETVPVTVQVKETAPVEAPVQAPAKAQVPVKEPEPEVDPGSLPLTAEQFAYLYSGGDRSGFSDKQLSELCYLSIDYHHHLEQKRMREANTYGPEMFRPGEFYRETPDGVKTRPVPLEDTPLQRTRSIGDMWREEMAKSRKKLKVNAQVQQPTVSAQEELLKQRREARAAASVPTDETRYQGKVGCIREILEKMCGVDASNVATYADLNDTQIDAIINANVNSGLTSFVQHIRNTRKSLNI